MSHFFRALKRIVIILLMLPICVYLLLLVINLIDSSPSNQVEIYQAQIDKSDRLITQNLEDNAYIFSLGFDAPQGDSVIELGKARFTQQTTPTQQASRAILQADKTPLTLPLESCLSQEDFVDLCLSLLEDDELQTLLTKNRWLIERYQALINMSQWQDLSPNIVQIEHEANNQILLAQKLYLLDLYAQAKTLNSTFISEALNDEMLFWKNLSEQTHKLVFKMISNSAMLVNMQLGEMIIVAAQDNQTIALPNSWQQPLSSSVFSFEQIKLGEWQYASHMMANMLDNNDKNNQITSFIEKTLVALAKPLLKTQNTANHYADHLQTESITPQCNNFSFGNLSYFAYNPIGKLLLCTLTPSFDRYQKKIEQVEQHRAQLAQRLP